MDSVTQRLNREQTVEQENNALTDALLSGSIRPCGNRSQLPASLRGFWALEFGAEDSRMNYFNLILHQRKGCPAEICVCSYCFCNGLRKPALICSLPILSSGYLGRWPKCFIWKLIAGRMNVLRQRRSCSKLMRAHPVLIQGEELLFVMGRLPCCQKWAEVLAWAVRYERKLLVSKAATSNKLMNWPASLGYYLKADYLMLSFRFEDNLTQIKMFVFIDGVSSSTAVSASLWPGKILQAAEVIQVSCSS